MVYINGRPKVKAASYVRNGLIQNLTGWKMEASTTVGGCWGSGMVTGWPSTHKERYSRGSGGIMSGMERVASTTETVIYIKGTISRTSRKGKEPSSIVKRRCAIVVAIETTNRTDTEVNDGPMERYSRGAILTGGRTASGGSSGRMAVRTLGNSWTIRSMERANAYGNPALPERRAPAFTKANGSWV